MKLKIGSEFEQTRWNQSLFVLDLLIPDSIGDMVEDYWNGVDDRLREIVFAREVQQPTSTLQELAVGYGLTRERIRQMESQAIHEYYDWWDNLNLSLKLLISDKQEHIQLDSLYTPLQAQLIMRLIVKKKHPELGQWVYTADSLFSKFKMSLKQVVMDKRWIKNSDIRDSMNADCSIFTQADLEKGMHSLGFHFVQDVSVWTQNKGLTMTELIQQYMSQFNLKVINADEQSFERIDSWSKHYFNRKIATSMRAFKAGLGKNTNLLPVGNGAFRAYQADRYPQPLLHLTKNKLDKRFEEGYLFARDAWLLDTVKVQLADDMTKDEWYQAFKREYSAEYSFGTGRNNDVYPLSQKQLTINQQIELVARQNLKGYSLFQLKQDYGWEPYSVQQATSVTPSIYLHHNQLFWVNVVEADKIIKTAMSEYFEQTFKTTELTTMQKAYDFFNEFMLDQDPKAFDEMQIYNVEALSSYLSSFSEIDIVGNFFIIDSNGLPDLPRESRKVWAEYLQRIACKPLTEYQIFEAVNADGTTRSTWDQGHELKMKDARIVPISKDLFVASRNILRTDELDSLVHRSMSSLLDKKAFVATQTLSDDVYTSLPDAHNREFPDQIFSWTPELFISYAEKLGYLRLSWPKSMIRGNCDVLVPKTSSFNSMEALMASLIIEWMKSETNENNLFVHAASLGLVPKRVDEYKQRFSRLFMNDQGFTVDGLGNVKRQKK
ncbi:hypothetical protein FC18_GL001654 [Lacticaseibacillus sharpeae JCM 1186 = DSM 20505]|uniref:RNA polymerase sigma-70 region 4 domain-containing protein n=1 Tax=Lacticaseibacillus sharpeae JCM 1186 = DSM 20505 TaxID=1291052 RepID=A0A0R1ZJG8_9LACO|nr:hypothetical protein FC18_GL001654 [Lacticaseibacillus sharpeae JCM 1186 = DSM 20505]